MEAERTLRELVHPTDYVEHSGFAAARFTEYNKQLSLVYVEVHAFEHARNCLAVFKFLRNVAKRDYDGLRLGYINVKPALVYRRGRHHGHYLADVIILVRKRLSVDTVEELYAAERLVAVFERHAYH